jgi:hypothetical protein
MTPATNESPRRLPTPPDSPRERAEEIRARMDALLDRLKPPLPERRES